MYGKGGEGRGGKIEVEKEEGSRGRVGGDEENKIVRRRERGREGREERGRSL